MIKAEDKEKLKEFGENLKKIRKARGFSLRSLSYECEIDYSDISKIERGVINITYLTLLQLAKALDIAPGQLVDFHTADQKK